MRFFTSDQHIGHANILKLGTGRPFSSLSHMHSTILKNHNAIVSPEDEVYFLGDIALGDVEESLRFFSGLNGKKFLIPGNHDLLFSFKNSATRIERFTKLYETYGFTILPENTSIKIAGREVALSHFPYQEKLFNKTGYDKYLKNRPVDKGLPLIHGHTHQRAQQPLHSRMFHVGVDSNNFTPVSEEDIVVWLDELKFA
jgi:calcineurin-like phosphoesterase family protein